MRGTEKEMPLTGWDAGAVAAIKEKTMHRSFWKQGRGWSWLFSLALLALVAGPSYGQLLPFCRPRAKGCVPMPVEPCPPAEERKPTPEPAPEPTPTPAPAPEPSPLLPDMLASAVGGEAVALAAPNMIGNLLNGSRSVSFIVNRVTGSTFLFDLGSTSIVNPKVADDNSPIPADRKS